MKRIGIFILTTILAFQFVMTPMYVNATAVSADMTAEVSELFYTIMINAMVAAGFLEADEMEYDDAMTCFDTFINTIAPTGLMTDAQGYAIDSSGNRLVLALDSSGCVIDLASTLIDGTSSLKPAKETWEKFKVINGGGGSNNPLGNGHINRVLIGACVFEGARAWLLANQDSLPVKQSIPLQGNFSDGTNPERITGYFTFLNGNESGEIGTKYYVNTALNYGNTCSYFIVLENGTYTPYVFNPSSNNIFTFKLNATAYHLYDDGREVYNFSGATVGAISNPYEYSLNIPLFGSQELALAWYRHVYFGDPLPDGTTWLNSFPLDMPGLIRLLPNYFSSIADNLIDVADLTNLMPKLKLALNNLPALDPDPAVNQQTYQDTVTDTVTDTVPATDPATDPAVDPAIKPNPEANQIIKKYSFDLSTVFPFCIPFDLVALLKTLNASPKAPHFEIPINFAALEYEYTFVIDLAFLDTAMEVFRTCVTISFVLGLMYLTPKMIKW